MYIADKPSPKATYALAAVFGAAAIALAEKAVSFYHTADRMVPTEQQLHHSLEVVIQWREAAGQQIGQVDQLLRMQAQDYAEYVVRQPSFFNAEAAAGTAVLCALLAYALVHKPKKR